MVVVVVIAVSVVAAYADSAPVPARAVVANTPGVGAPRVVVVPCVYKRLRRAPVVHPCGVVGAVVHKVSINVVVPITSPIDAGVGFNGVGVGVDIGHHFDALAGGRHLVPREVGVFGGRLGVTL